MSVTASPALITASCAAATNDRPAGYRRNSDVWDKNTRRGGGSLGITHSIPAFTQRENHQLVEHLDQQESQVVVAVAVGFGGLRPVGHARVSPAARCLLNHCGRRAS